MKKLKKISINPEKVIKNEELVNLRGGYGLEYAQIYCKQGVTGPYANPQPCKLYGSNQELLDEIDLFCVEGDAKITSPCTL